MQRKQSTQTDIVTLSKEQSYTAITAIVAALLIAASNVGQTSSASLLGGYSYWIVRIAIEGALFIMVRDSVERLFGGSQPDWMVFIAAVLLSLVPFVLAITTFDIVLGYPELGAVNPAAVPASKVREFGLELIYLLDNHVFLCVLLTIPRLLLGNAHSVDQNADTILDATELSRPTRATMFTELEPPLKGELLWAEAQEHYVRLTTSEESRMVLHRFADVLRDLSDDDGIRVHRSHWVSINAVREVFRDGANLRIRLLTDDVVPVSRSYRALTERRLKEAELLA